MHRGRLTGGHTPGRTAHRLLDPLDVEPHEAQLGVHDHHPGAGARSSSASASSPSSPPQSQQPSPSRTRTPMTCDAA